MVVNVGGLDIAQTNTTFFPSSLLPQIPSFPIGNMGRKAKNKQPPPAPFPTEKKLGKRKLEGDVESAKAKKPRAGGKSVRFSKANEGESRGGVKASSGVKKDRKGSAKSAMSKGKEAGDGKKSKSNGKAAEDGVSSDDGFADDDDEGADENEKLKKARE
jgi:hypothetical protein